MTRAPTVLLVVLVLSVLGATAVPVAALSFPPSDDFGSDFAGSPSSPVCQSGTIDPAIELTDVDGEYDAAKVYAVLVGPDGDNHDTVVLGTVEGGSGTVSASGTPQPNEGGVGDWTIYYTENPTGGTNEATEVVTTTSYEVEKCDASNTTTTTTATTTEERSVTFSGGADRSTPYPRTDAVDASISSISWADRESLRADITVDVRSISSDFADDSDVISLSVVAIAPSGGDPVTLTSAKTSEGEVELQGIDMTSVTAADGDWSIYLTVNPDVIGPGDNPDPETVGSGWTATVSGYGSGSSSPGADDSSSSAGGLFSGDGTLPEPLSTLVSLPEDTLNKFLAFASEPVVFITGVIRDWVIGVVLGIGTALIASIRGAGQAVARSLGAVVASGSWLIGGVFSPVADVALGLTDSIFTTTATMGVFSLPATGAAVAGLGIGALVAADVLLRVFLGVGEDVPVVGLPVSLANELYRQTGRVIAIIRS